MTFQLTSERRFFSPFGVIRESRLKKPFKVVSMKSADFTDITDASLKEHVTIRQVTTDKQSLNLQRVMLLSHKERKFEIEVKYSHGPLQPSSYVSCEIQRMRKGRPSTSAGLASAEFHRSMNLMLDATSARPSTMNYKKLLRFIPPHQHAEYKKLSFDTSAD